MFFLALSRRPLHSPVPSARAYESTIAGFHLTVVTDAWTTRVMREGHGLELIESVAPELGHVAGLTLVRVLLDEDLALLQLSRSLVGGHSIYYHLNASGELLCSSHIGLLAQAGVVLKENRRTLAELFVYQYIMPPSTLFEGVAQVPGGATIRLKLIDNRWQLAGLLYEDLPSPSRRRRIRDVDELFQRLRGRLEEAIARLAPRRDELAVLLSGGLDSSALWVLSHRLHGVRRSYSAGFPFEAEDSNFEKEYALSAAAEFGSKHRYLEPTTSTYVRGLVESIAAAEMPVHHLQSVLLFLLFRDLLPEHEKVVLTGEGAGALFGLDALVDLFRRERRLFRLRENRVAFRVLSSPGVLRCTHSLLTLIKKGWGLQAAFGADSPRNLPLDDPAHILWSARRFGDEAWVYRYFDVTPKDVVAGRQATLRDFGHHSLYDLWWIYDLIGETAATMSIWNKLAERNGKILYSPFLTTELLALASTAQWPVILDAERPVAKGIARRLGISEAIVARPKQSFSVKPERWARPRGPFEPFLLLLQKQFGAAEVQTLLVPDHNRAFTFWTMVNYAIWRSVVIEGESVDRLLPAVGMDSGGETTPPLVNLN